MASPAEKTLRHLRNTRDLRAEILSLAATLVATPERGRLTVVDPAISEATVRDEWHRLLPALAPGVRRRMSLSIEQEANALVDKHSGNRDESDVLLLDRPNYRHEVLRLLLGANLDDGGPQPIKGLMEKIGASQTPIREALAKLRPAGIVRSRGRGVEVIAEDVTAELLAKIRALPQTLRFRFERGARIKPPAALLKRALPLLRPPARTGWGEMSLSGTPVAQSDAPSLDLMGVPRLDLVAHVSRDGKTFDATRIRLLDDGLEPEPSILAPAPVVVTLVRAEARFTRDAGLEHARCAYPMDVFLSLLDLGLREQAMQYARAMRR